MYTEFEKDSFNTSPVSQIAHLLGISLLPPKHHGMVFNMLFLGTQFALIWGFAMWFFMDLFGRIGTSSAIVLCVLVGLSSGLWMAWQVKASSQTENQRTRQF